MSMVSMTTTMATLIPMSTSTTMGMSTCMGRDYITGRNTSTGILIRMFTRIRIPTRETNMSMSMKRTSGDWWKCGRRSSVRTTDWLNAIEVSSEREDFSF
jgi:hypothetical protein